MASHYDVILALIIMEVNLVFALYGPEIHDENIDLRKLCPVKCPPGFSSSCPRNVESRCVRCIKGVNYSKHHSRSALCRPCSRCRDGEFEAEPCTLRKDVVCQKCSECPPGFGVRSLCAKTSDTVCEACPLGTASDENSKVEVCKPCAMCKEKGIHLSSDETESQSLNKRMNEGKRTVENLLYFTPQNQIAPGEDYEHPSIQVVQKAGAFLPPTGGGEIVVNVMKPSSEPLPTLPLSTSSPFSNYNAKASITAGLNKQLTTVSTDPAWLESKQSPSVPISSVTVHVVHDRTVEDRGTKRGKSNITEEMRTRDRRRTEEPSSYPREKIIQDLTKHSRRHVFHGAVLYNHTHILTVTKPLETESVQATPSEGNKGLADGRPLLKSTEGNSIVKDTGRERNKAVNQMSSSFPIPKWLIGVIAVVVVLFFAVGVFFLRRQKRRMTPADSYKSGSLSEKVLHCLSQDACACWKALGRQLGLTDNHLNQIEADNPGQTYEQCYVMLKAWYQAMFPLTCEDLGRALKNINREDLVFKYCAVQPAPGYDSDEEQWSYKDGIPTGQEIDDLAYGVLGGGNWKQFGRALDLLDADLDQIGHSCHDLLEKSYGMLNKWMEREGSAATYENLAKGLNEVGRKDLVQKFCCKMKY